MATAVRLERPVYHGWPQVPEHLVTRTQAAREKLVVPPELVGTPDAYCRTRAGTYPLYSRAELMPAPPPKRPRKDWPTIFWARYNVEVNGWARALPDAAEDLFQLNRYAKHDTCTYRQRQEVYALKNRLLAILWRLDLCREAYVAHSPTYEKGECYSCGGSGVDDDGDECWKCDGTGIFKSGNRPYWALRFEIAGKLYAWHQPLALAPWARETGTPLLPEQIHKVVAETRPITLKRRQLPEARALVRWLCQQAELEWGITTTEPTLDDIPF